MKKLFVLIVLFSLVFAGNALADAEVNVGDSTNAPTGNGYAGSYSNNTASGQFIGWGITAGTTATNGGAFATGPVVAQGQAVSGGIGGVVSTSAAGGLGLGQGGFTLRVEGGAYGQSYAEAYKGSGTNRTEAWGGGFGEAQYTGYVSARYLFVGGSVLNGYAAGASGTVANADAGRNATDAWSNANAVTGSISGASQTGNGSATAFGAGEVGHQTYAEKNGSAWAGTTGNASYTYNNSGLGAGVAATSGTSNVTQTQQTAFSQSRSVGIAFSTGGTLPQPE